MSTKLPPLEQERQEGKETHVAPRWPSFIEDGLPFAEIVDVLSVQRHLTSRMTLRRGLVPLVLLEFALASCGSSAVRGAPELAQWPQAQYDARLFSK